MPDTREVFIVVYENKYGSSADAFATRKEAQSAIESYWEEAFLDMGFSKEEALEFGSTLPDQIRAYAESGGRNGCEWTELERVMVTFPEGAGE